MFWLLVGVTLAIFLYLTLVKPFNFWKNREVPQYPFWVTLKEMLLGFAQRRSLTEMMQKPYKDFSGSRYVGIYQFYRPILFLRDPDLIKQLAVKDFDYFVDHSQFVPENSEPLWEKNLFSLKGDKWRDMRATLSPSFTSSKMKIMFGVISECAKQFVKYFEEQNSKLLTIEMKDAFTRFTNDVIASSAFGVACDSMRDPNNDFYLMGKEVTNFKRIWKSIQFLFMVISPTLSKVLGFSFFDKKVSSYFTKLVKDNIRTRERESIIRQDMIYLLMEARKERQKNDMVAEDDTDIGFAGVDEPKVNTNKEEKRKKEQITDVDIVAQALIFFFAGFDSVSTLMCFMVHELAINPEVQERLQCEIDDTLHSCDGSVTYEAILKMKYMDMVVSESLRMWPAAVATDRMCVKSYTIPPSVDGEKPLCIKEGDVIGIPVFGFHRDPQFYPEPDRFDPERFNDENKANIIPYTYLPFGVGPRSCIGNRFALLETKLVFFHILSKFDITVVEKTNVPIKISKSPFQLTADGGFWLGLRPRQLQ